jgi:hypothetical protein
MVVSSFPLGEIIRNQDTACRIAKWSVELMGETLAYAPRKAIKSQILADFVAEWTDTQLPPPHIQEECWTLYFDGSMMKTGAGAGLLLGEHMRYAVCLHFPVSNVGGTRKIRNTTLTQMKVQVTFNSTVRAQRDCNPSCQ